MNHEISSGAEKNTAYDILYSSLTDSDIPERFKSAVRVILDAMNKARDGGYNRVIVRSKGGVVRSLENYFASQVSRLVGQGGLTEEEQHFVAKVINILLGNDVGTREEDSLFDPTPHRTAREGLDWRELAAGEHLDRIKL